MKSVWMPAIGVAVWMCALDAHAGFLVESKPAAASPQTEACDYPGVRDLGGPVAARPLIAPLTTEHAASALRRIVPRTWEIVGDAPPRATVSWRGGRPWLAVLQDVAVDAGLCITLDHAKQTASVHVTASSGASLAATEPAEPEAARAPVVMPAQPEDVDLGDAEVVSIDQADASLTTDGAELGVDTAEPVDIAPATPPKIYGVKGGEVLEETLARWCETEGWTLVWQVDEFEYPQEVSYEFPAGTTFEVAVKTVVRAYWRTKHPLVARPSLNNVLVITGR